MPTIGPVEIVIIFVICLAVVIPVGLIVALIVWLSKRSSQKSPLGQSDSGSSLTSTATHGEATADQLGKLQSLLENGLITQEEFSKKRAEILDRL